MSLCLLHLCQMSLRHCKRTKKVRSFAYYLSDCSFAMFVSISPSLSLPLSLTLSFMYFYLFGSFSFYQFLSLYIKMSEDVKINRSTNGQMDCLTDQQMNRGTHHQLNRWTDQQMGRSTDGKINRWKDQQVD